MRRTKIAPALDAVVNTWPPPYSKTGINAALVSIQAKAEFRALVSLARAAERIHRDGMLHPSTLITFAEIATNWRLTRALARLRSVSVGKRGKPAPRGARGE